MHKKIKQAIGSSHKKYPPEIPPEIRKYVSCSSILLTNYVNLSF